MQNEIVRIIGKADSQRFILFRQHLNPNDASPFVIAIINRLFCLVRPDMEHSVWVNAKKTGKLLNGYQHMPALGLRPAGIEAPPSSEAL